MWKSSFRMRCDGCDSELVLIRSTLLRQPRRDEYDPRLSNNADSTLDQTRLLRWTVFNSNTKPQTIHGMEPCEMHLRPSQDRFAQFTLHVPLGFDASLRVLFLPPSSFLAAILT